MATTRRANCATQGRRSGRAGRVLCPAPGFAPPPCSTAPHEARSGHPHDPFRTSQPCWTNDPQASQARSPTPRLPQLSNAWTPLDVTPGPERNSTDNRREQNSTNYRRNTDVGGLFRTAARLLTAAGQTGTYSYETPPLNKPQAGHSIRQKVSGGT